MFLVDDSINLCSFNLAVLHFSLLDCLVLHPYVHPGLSWVWPVISLRWSWYLLLLAPQVESMSLLYSRSPLIALFFFLFCCVLASTQCPNLLLSSGVSISISLVGLGLVSQCCASAFSRIHVILCLSLRSTYNMPFLWFQHALPVSMNVRLKG